MADGNFDNLNVASNATIVGDLNVGHLIDMYTGGQALSRFGSVQVSDDVVVPNPKDPAHPTHTKMSFPLVLQPNGGNVGIGTMDPGTKLSITTEVQDQPGLSITSPEHNRSGGMIFIDSLGKSNDAHRLLTGRKRNSAGDAYIDWTLEIQPGDEPALAFWRAYRPDDDPDGTKVQFSFPSPLVLGWNGNVGIGTAVPSTQLQVQGRVSIDPGSSLHSGLTFYSPDGAAWFHIDNGPAGGRPTGRLRISHGGMPGENEIMNLVQNGRVGIGTASPDATLQVNSGDDLPQVELTQTTEGKNARLRFQSFVTDPDGKIYPQLWDIEAGSGYLGFSSSNWGKVMTLTADGNVNVTRNVNVTGDIILTGADCAEDFYVVDAEEIEPGTVMVIDESGVLRPGQKGYDKRVAGVISGAGDLRPGITLDKKPTVEKRWPLALVGKVNCKVDAQYGSINVGDLLTTSPTSGHAMKASDPAASFGAVIGKALRALEQGQGLIPVLVALQ